jgi:hypothetical protein
VIAAICPQHQKSLTATFFPCKIAVKRSFFRYFHKYSIEKIGFSFALMEILEPQSQRFYKKDARKGR